MTPGHRQWKKSILTGDALCAVWWPFPPFTLNNSTSLGLKVYTMIWIILHGSNVTGATPPSIYSVAPGSLKLLSDPNVFCVHFTAVDSSNLLDMSLDLFSVMDMSLDLKMGRKQMCPDDKDKKKKKKKGKKDDSPKKDRGKSSHSGDNIGQFTAAQMQACLDEIALYKNRMITLGLKKMEKSANKISHEHGLSPSTVSKRTTGKVQGLGSQLRGARRGRVLSASKFQATQYIRPGLPVMYPADLGFKRHRHKNLVYLYYLVPFSKSMPLGG